MEFSKDELCDRQKWQYAMRGYWTGFFRVEDLDNYLPPMDRVTEMKAKPWFEDFVKESSEGYLTPPGDRSFIMHSSRRKFIHTQSELWSKFGLYHQHSSYSSTFAVKEFDTRNNRPDNALFDIVEGENGSTLLGFIPEWHGFLDLVGANCMIGRTVQKIAVRGPKGSGVPENKFVTIIPRMTEKQVYDRLPFCYSMQGDAIRYTGLFKIVKLNDGIKTAYPILEEEGVYGLLLVGYVDGIENPKVIEYITPGSYACSWVIE